jgi:hypothetical protein
VEILLALGLGLGLSAATGFRVFVPLLGLSAAGLAGWYALPPGSEWLGSWQVCLALATATLLEIGAYYTPWLDHLLDGLATPLAALAGGLLAFIAFADLPPALRWLLAIIAGGGASSLVQLGSVTLRMLSGGSTGGLGNPAVATLELLAAVGFTGLALLLPLLALGAVALLIGLLVLLLRRLARRPRAK